MESPAESIRIKGDQLSSLLFYKIGKVHAARKGGAVSFISLREINLECMRKEYLLAIHITWREKSVESAFLSIYLPS